MNPLNIEIQDLRILSALAATGSLSGAARALSTNQGNVSRHLQRIERTTGETLFRRDHRGVVPTPAGRLLLDGADTLLPRIDQLLRTSAEHPEATDGTAVRVGSVPTLLLPTIAGQISALLSGLSLSLHTAECGRELLLMLGAGQLEAALVWHFPLLDEPFPDGVRTSLIAEERLLVGVSPQHQLAERDVVTLVDLAAERCVLADGGHHVEVRDHFLALVAVSGVSPVLSYAADEASAAALACASGGVFPAYPPPPPIPGVAFRPLVDARAALHLRWAWTPRSRLAPYTAPLTTGAALAYRTCSAGHAPTTV